ncbi:MAG: M28 family peptidase [Nitrospiraceae bacterium]
MTAGTSQSALTARLLKHLRHLAGERHPHQAPAALQYAEQYLTRTFQEAGGAVKAHAFRALGGTYHNVVAAFPASSLRARQTLPPLILGAHYDTHEGSPGADDNASALAVLLETAAALGAHPPARPVWCVAFCLEEFNLLGSRAYVASLRKQGRAIRGAIILECVGFANDALGTQRQPPIPVPLPNVGNFLGVVGNDPARPLTTALTAAAAEATHPLPIVAMTVPGNGEALPDTRRSDHAAFWDYGYPAVMLTDTANFRNPHYHQPTDTVETLNLDFMAQVTRCVTSAVRALTSADSGEGV